MNWLLGAGIRFEECPVGQDRGLWFWFWSKRYLTAFIHKSESGLILDSALCKQDADSEGEMGPAAVPLPSWGGSRPSPDCPGLLGPWSLPFHYGAPC